MTWEIIALIASLIANGMTMGVWAVIIIVFVGSLYNKRVSITIPWFGITIRNYK